MLTRRFLPFNERIIRQASLIFLTPFTGKPEVMALMDPNQKLKKAPKFIRSKLYKYHFTTSKDAQDYWTREEEREYSPVMTIDDPPALKEYLNKIGILTPLKRQPSNTILTVPLQFLRIQANRVPHHILVWSISWIILPICMNLY